MLKLRFHRTEELLEIDHRYAFAVACVANEQHVDVGIHSSGPPSEEYTSAYGSGNCGESSPDVEHPWRLVVGGIG